MSSPDKVTWLARLVRELDLPCPRWNLCFSCSCNSVRIGLRLALLLQILFFVVVSEGIGSGEARDIRSFNCIAS